jgi:Resolvase, N terminal domain
VVRVFKDECRSGYTGEIRPGFEDMLSHLGKGQADVLIARHHDRLTRNSDDFAGSCTSVARLRSRSACRRAASWTSPQRAAGATDSWRPVDHGTSRRSGAGA